MRNARFQERKKRIFGSLFMILCFRLGQKPTPSNVSAIHQLTIL
jgi:hypothetical protein